EVVEVALRLAHLDSDQPFVRRRSSGGAGVFPEEIARGVRPGNHGAVRLPGASAGLAGGTRRDGFRRILSLLQFLSCCLGAAADRFIFQAWDRAATARNRL